MIRLFTAIEIPEHIRTRLSFMQAGIPGARWSAIENLHLTLRFIGEVDQHMAGDIDQMLSGIGAGGFELTLKGTGAFGGREPRAVWAGVAPNPALLHLVAKIESVLQRLGLPAESRKYAPHVTLARLRDAPMPKLREYLAAHNLFDSGPFAVNSFSLFSSFPSAQGSLYRMEQSYALGP